jgi:hypothetical protein
LSKLFLLLGIFSIVISSAEIMVIHRKNGTVAQIPISDISKLTFDFSDINVSSSRQFINFKEITANIYPNPFNPTTSIRYTIPTVSHVSISIINANGKILRMILNKKMQPGEYILQWDGKDEAGKRAASGIYMASITVGNKIISKKGILIQ